MSKFRTRRRMDQNTDYMGRLPRTRLPFDILMTTRTSGCWMNNLDFYIESIDNLEKAIFNRVKIGWDAPFRRSGSEVAGALWAGMKSTMRALRMRTTGFSSMGRILSVCHGRDEPPLNYIHLTLFPMDKDFLDFIMNLLDKNITLRRSARRKRSFEINNPDVVATNLVRTKKDITDRKDFVEEKSQPRKMRMNIHRVLQKMEMKTKEEEKYVTEILEENQKNLNPIQNVIGQNSWMF
jgi:hypothetical protein